MSKFAYFAGGCFWGIEYYFNKQAGVIDALSGYMGGNISNPSYEQVCTKQTGHLEVVRVEYDPTLVSYESLAKLFFEIHDPSQEDGQGPDRGPQYLSAVFVFNDEEKKIIQNLIERLERSGLHVATKIIEGGVFYKAEDYHQYFYAKKGSTPYCHVYTKRFD